MSTQTTTRKQVRQAIVETAEALTALKPQWEQRDDLKPMVVGVEREINEALRLLQNSAPTEQVRQAQAAAVASLVGLREALAKPAGAVEPAKPVVRWARGEVAAPEVRELFRDDQAGVLVTWILDPAEPKFLVTHTESGGSPTTLLELQATRSWASEKKIAIETGRRKACEVLGIAYEEPKDGPVTICQFSGYTTPVALTHRTPVVLTYRTPCVLTHTTHGDHAPPAVRVSSRSAFVDDREAVWQAGGHH